MARLHQELSLTIKSSRGYRTLADQPGNREHREPFFPDGSTPSTQWMLRLHRCERAAEAGLDGSRKRIDRGRHQRSRLGPEQRPRGAHHADHGIRRCVEPDQIAVRRRRTHVVRGGFRNRDVAAQRRSRSTSTLVATSTEVASRIQSLSSDIERTLSAAGAATATRFLPAHGRRKAPWWPRRRTLRIRFVAVVRHRTHAVRSRYRRGKYSRYGRARRAKHAAGDINRSCG